jgi:acyl-coenzyme A synthetase/AMP-(fatty) acid ligase
VQKGDRVLTVQRQSPELHLITLAVAHVGGVVSLLSPQMRARPLAPFLRRAGPSVCFWSGPAATSASISRECWWYGWTRD